MKKNRGQVLTCNQEQPEASCEVHSTVRASSSLKKAEDNLEGTVLYLESAKSIFNKRPESFEDSDSDGLICLTGRVLAEDTTRAAAAPLAAEWWKSSELEEHKVGEICPKQKCYRTCLADYRECCDSGRRQLQSVTPEGRTEAKNEMSETYVTTEVKVVHQPYSRPVSKGPWPFLPQGSCGDIEVDKRRTSEPTLRYRSTVGKVSRPFKKTLSLHRMKQFPIYNWSQVDLGSNVHYLINSSHQVVKDSVSRCCDVVKSAWSLVQSVYLAAAVYIGLMLLTVEFTGCIVGLALGSKPPGLVFMVTMLTMLGFIGFKAISHDKNCKRKH